MKNLFSISILLITSFISTNANAQFVTITETHQIPSIGDTIHYLNANPFGFNTTGTGTITSMVWDYSGLVSTGSYDFIYVDPATIPDSLGPDSFPDANIARGESGFAGYFYYQNTSNDINRLGWYSDTTYYGIYKDSTIATEFHFPITAGNTFTSTYHGNYSPANVGEDSMRIENGSVFIDADMQGQLILPTGTLNDVLRLHVTENFHVITYSTGIPLIDNLVTDNIYYWFVDTILQPVIYYGTTSVDGNVQATFLRYQPIQIPIPSGISNNNKGNLNVYPNPSEGKFTIENYNLPFRNYDLEIYNLLGERIPYSKIEHPSSDEIDISDLPKGVYFVRIYSEKRMITEKIVIE